VPRGGPSGGDGAAAATSIWSHPHKIPFFISGSIPSTKPAADSREGSNRTGHEAHRSTSRPPGTVVYDADTGEQLHDFTTPGERFMVARGGRGGRGKPASPRPLTKPPLSTSRPRGTGKAFRLELKLLGCRISWFSPTPENHTHLGLSAPAKMPTIRSPRLNPARRCTARRFPQLRDRDIPGLMKRTPRPCLGIQFLRHVERTRLLAHLVRCIGTSGREPAHDSK